MASSSSVTRPRPKTAGDGLVDDANARPEPPTLAAASSSSLTNPNPEHLYSTTSPVFSPSQEYAAFGSSTTSLPFQPPTPSVDSPPIVPPSAAYLSHPSQSSLPEPMGYTPLNDFASGAKSALKGKGRARNQGWVDLERGGDGGGGTLGEDEELEMVKEGWERVEGDSQRSPTSVGGLEYPPPLAMSEEDKEEKRIADNLARMQEKDAARRRAARESKYLKSQAKRAGSGSSSALGRRNRWSVFGSTDASDPQAGHMPLSYTGSPPPTASPILSPTSSTFASSSSHASQPTQHDPMSPTLPTASYQGREWVGGGQALQQAGANGGRRPGRRQLGFWENLCGTGRDRRPGDDDDDSDEDVNQGRTNPFE